MSTIVLGVGDLGATREANGVVKTFALGSCVAVIILDPETHCVAMDHVALPDSKACPDRAKDHPGYFADTGIPATLETMKKNGSKTNGRALIVKLVGGASVMDPNNTFNIGKRNVLAIHKILWQFGMGAAAEDVGGQISRTVSVDVDTGKVRITSPGRDDKEI